MTINVSWPLPAGKPYVVTVTTDNGDMAKVGADAHEVARFERLARDVVNISKSELTQRTD